MEVSVADVGGVAPQDIAQDTLQMSLPVDFHLDSHRTDAILDNASDSAVNSSPRNGDSRSSSVVSDHSNQKADAETFFESQALQNSDVPVNYSPSPRRKEGEFITDENNLSPEQAFPQSPQRGCSASVGVRTVPQEPLMPLRSFATSASRQCVLFVDTSPTKSGSPARERRLAPRRPIGNGHADINFITSARMAIPLLDSCPCVDWDSNPTFPSPVRPQMTFSPQTQTTPPKRTVTVCDATTQCSPVNAGECAGECALTREVSEFVPPSISPFGQGELEEDFLDCTLNHFRGSGGSFARGSFHNADGAPRSSEPNPLTPSRILRGRIHIPNFGSIQKASSVKCASLSPRRMGSLMLDAPAPENEEQEGEACPAQTGRECSVTCDHVFDETSGDEEESAKFSENRSRGQSSDAMGSALNPPLTSRPCLGSAKDEFLQQENSGEEGSVLPKSARVLRFDVGPASCVSPSRALDCSSSNESSLSRDLGGSPTADFIWADRYDAFKKNQSRAKSAAPKSWRGGSPENSCERGVCPSPDWTPSFERDGDRGASVAAHGQRAKSVAHGLLSSGANSDSGGDDECDEDSMEASRCTSLTRLSREPMHFSMTTACAFVRRHANSACFRTLKLCRSLVWFASSVASAVLALTIPQLSGVLFVCCAVYALFTVSVSSVGDAIFHDDDEMLLVKEHISTVEDLKNRFCSQGDTIEHTGLLRHIFISAINATTADLDSLSVAYAPDDDVGLRQMVMAYHHNRYRIKLFVRQLDSSWLNRVLLYPLRDAYRFGLVRGGAESAFSQIASMDLYGLLVQRWIDTTKCLVQSEHMPCPSLAFEKEAFAMRFGVALREDSIDSLRLLLEWVSHPANLTNTRVRTLLQLF